MNEGLQVLPLLYFHYYACTFWMKVRNRNETLSLKFSPAEHEACFLIQSLFPLQKHLELLDAGSSTKWSSGEINRTSHYCSALFAFGSMSTKTEKNDFLSA